MSDEPKTAPKGWTDTEKWALVLQIITRMDKPIPWAEIDLPEGRTQKGCVVMLDKEKKKIREALAAEGKELVPFKGKSTPKKRTKADDGEEGGEEGTSSPNKKKATPRKKKATAKAAEEEGEAEKEVKAEPAAEGDEELV